MAGEKVLGSLSREMTLRRMVLMTKKEEKLYKLHASKVREVYSPLPDVVQLHATSRLLTFFTSTPGILLTKRP